MKALAINLGTSKVVAALAQTGQPPAAVELGWPSQIPSDWIARTVEAAHHAVGNNVVEIDYLAVCGTSGTFLFVDNYGEPVGNPCLYNDVNVKFIDGVQTALHGSPLAQEIGEASALTNVWGIWHSIPSIDQERISHIIPQATWVAYRFFYQPGAVWSRVESDPFNLRKLGLGIGSAYGIWNTELLRRLDLPERLFPVPVAAGTAIGPTSTAARSLLNFSVKTICHGVTDATAESTFLLGDSNRGVSIVAGSTSSVKAVCPLDYVPHPQAYIGNHPLRSDCRWATMWATTAENIRRLALASGSTPGELIEAAWEIPENIQLAPAELARSAIVQEELTRPPSVVVTTRSILDGIVEWEGRAIDRFRSDGLLTNVGSILMIGGTTISRDLMMRRAKRFESPIHVFPAAGALGVLAPGLILNGACKSFAEFAAAFRGAPEVYLPVN